VPGRPPMRGRQQFAEGLATPAALI
jgi:hypothetical protein